MSQQPNILLFITDQQAFNALSCFGNRYCNTPYIDRIADRGMRFDYSYCTAPVCGPSRASLATGLMPHEMDADHNDPSIPPDVDTFGQRLGAVGYQTYWVGKWHVPDSYPQPELGQEIKGFTNVPTPLVPDYGLGAATDQIITRNAGNLLTNTLPGTEQPWFVSVSLHNPHDVCLYVRNWGVVEHRNVDRFPPVPNNFERPIDESEFMERCRNRQHYGDETRSTFEWKPEHWRAYLHSYYRMVEDVDWQIGQVLGAAERGGWNLDETLIIFTSDHGENCGAHRFAVKLTLYEQAAKVPLIYALPKSIAAGAVDRKHLVSGMDLAPTICDYAGADASGMTGKSMRPLLEGNATQWRDHLICELSPETENHEMKARMVRTDRYKYICCSHGDKPQMLFDLQADPGETKSLAYQPGMRDVLGQHQQLLWQWIEQTKDHFTPPAEVVASA